MATSSKSWFSETPPIWWWPFMGVIYLVIGACLALANVIVWSAQGLLWFFRLLQVPRLHSRPLLVNWMVGGLFLSWTACAVVSCRSTVVHSEATVSVRGYTRSDGTYVRAHARRAPGVAASDERANRDSAWVRWLIALGWLGGCGLLGAFYASAMATQDSDRQFGGSASAAAPPPPKPPPRTPRV
jgi:hypothetical protein